MINDSFLKIFKVLIKLTNFGIFNMIELRIDEILSFEYLHTQILTKLALVPIINYFLNDKIEIIKFQPLGIV